MELLLHCLERKERRTIWEIFAMRSRLQFDTGKVGSRCTETEGGDWKIVMQRHLIACRQEHESIIIAHCNFVSYRG